MIVAIDLTSAAQGDVPASARHLIAALTPLGSPARQLVILSHDEHRNPLRHATHGLATVLTLERPEPNPWPIGDYRRRKAALLQSHGVQLLHVAGGALDALDVGVPVVWSVGDMIPRASPPRFAPAGRGTTWAASACRADAVVAANASVRDDLVRQFGVDARKVFVAAPSPWEMLPTLAAAYAHATRPAPLRKAA